MTIRHRGRGAQVFICLGKQLRMFVYQNDWKVLPMAVLIAGLVGMVVRKGLFVNMEGTLMGAFAMVCVSIWNGCFNSIQVICREREVIKREHRSGMHISSYIFSHMLYQALLCLAQTAVTLYVTQLVGVKYPSEGLVTRFFLIDFGISMFLIAYASDMLSLWVSSLAHTTTTAMTIMPFVLIFQLVFSGGMLTLPAWTEPLTHFTISNPGLKVVATQANINDRPYATISNLVSKMRDSEIGGTVTVGQVLDLLQDADNPAIAELRAKELGRVLTLGEIRAALESSETFAAFRQEHIMEKVTLGDVFEILQTSEDLKEIRDYRFGDPGITVGGFLELLAGTEPGKALLAQPLTRQTTVGDVLDAIEASGIADQFADTEIDARFTIGQIVDMAAENGDVQAQRDQKITVRTTVGKLMDLVGEGRVKTFLADKAAEVSYVEDYEYSQENVVSYWLHLLLFVVGFAALATITLEFIDKDKRL